MADVHVVPDGHDWALEVDGEKRGRLETRSEAITRGSQLAGDTGCELVIHGMNRQIREKDGRGADPRDVPG